LVLGRCGAFRRSRRGYAGATGAAANNSNNIRNNGTIETNGGYIVGLGALGADNLLFNGGTITNATCAMESAVGRSGSVA